MKFLIIIPAYNEAEHLEECLQSLHLQTFSDYEIKVVNDGSTDSTGSILDHFVKDKARFSVLHLPKSQHEPGAKVVRTFNKGLEMFDLAKFDVVCKFDADIIFPNDYLEKMNRVFWENPKVGMASGWVSILKNNQWVFEAISSKQHIRGPIKAYRKACFLGMNGLKTCLGWDNLDVLLAKKNGWYTQTVPELWVKHLRPTASVYQSEKAKKSGIYFYNIGLSFPLALIASLKSSVKNRSISEFFVCMKSFLSCNHALEISPDEIKFIRKLRWQEVFKKLKLL